MFNCFGNFCIPATLHYPPLLKRGNKIKGIEIGKHLLELKLDKLEPKEFAKKIDRHDYNLFMRISHKGWVKYLDDLSQDVYDTDLYKYLQNFEDLKHYTRHIFENVTNNDKAQALRFLLKVIKILVKDHDNYNSAYALITALQGCQNLDNILKVMRKKDRERFYRYNYTQDMLLRKQKKKSPISVAYLPITIEDLTNLHMERCRRLLGSPLERKVLRIVKDYMYIWSLGREELEYV